MRGAQSVQDHDEDDDLLPSGLEERLFSEVKVDVQILSAELAASEGEVARHSAIDRDGERCLLQLQAELDSARSDQSAVLHDLETAHAELASTVAEVRRPRDPVDIPTL